MKMFSKSERKRFTRWLNKPSGKRVRYSFEFEACGVLAGDAALTLELIDAISRFTMEMHDVPAMRLRSARINGRRVI